MIISELPRAALAAALLSVALLLLALALLLRLLPRVASPFSGISMEGQAQWLHLVQGGRAELVREVLGAGGAFLFFVPSYD